MLPCYHIIATFNVICVIYIFYFSNLSEMLFLEAGGVQVINAS